MKVYLEVTKDKYELPVAVADSPYELAAMRNVSALTIMTSISREKAGRRWSKYKRVIIEEE